MHNWPRGDEILPPSRFPEGYRLEQLARADVPEVIRKIREWFPDVTVGAESVHLDERFYDERVALAGEEAERAVYAAIVRGPAGIVGFVSAAYDEASRTLYGRLGVIDPAYRGLGLGVLLGATFGEVLGRRVGAEILITTATLKHPRVQHVLEGQGFELVGLIPAFDRDMVSPGVVKRVYEAMYAKVLVGEEAILRPSPEGMSSRTAALFKHLFGS